MRRCLLTTALVPRASVPAHRIPELKAANRQAATRTPRHCSPACRSTLQQLTSTSTTSLPEARDPPDLMSQRDLEEARVLERRGSRSSNAHPRMRANRIESLDLLIVPGLQLHRHGAQVHRVHERGSKELATIPTQKLAASMPTLKACRICLPSTTTSCSAASIRASSLPTLDITLRTARTTSTRPCICPESRSRG